MGTKNLRLSKHFAVVLLMLVTACATSSKQKERSELKMGLGIGYLQSQRFPEAIGVLKEARELNSKSPEIENNLGLAYYGTENWKEAEQAFVRALAISPKFPEALSNLCSTYNQMRAFDAAINACQKALAVETYANPEFAMTNLGVSFMMKDDFKTAEDWLVKASRKNPAFCQSSTQLGKLYIQTKKYPLAVKNFETALRNCPLFQEAQYRLGIALYHMGQRKRSLRVFEELIQRHPDSSFAEPATKFITLLSSDGSSQ